MLHRKTTSFLKQFKTFPFFFLSVEVARPAGQAGKRLLPGGGENGEVSRVQRRKKVQLCVGSACKLGGAAHVGKDAQGMLGSV